MLASPHSDDNAFITNPFRLAQYAYVERSPTLKSQRALVVEVRLEYSECARRAALLHSSLAQVGDVRSLLPPWPSLILLTYM